MAKTTRENKMIIHQDTQKSNYIRGKKTIKVYERTTITVDNEADMPELLKEYTEKGWKLGFYDNKALQIGFELTMDLSKDKIETNHTPLAIKERFYIAFNALNEIANDLTYGKDMVDRAKKAITEIGEVK